MDWLNDLNPTFIWDCHVGHIDEKRIERLHKDGLLSSFDFELFDTCEPCLLGKMTKASFTSQSKRASDLLELIHFGLISYVVKGKKSGFQYFIIFTDDFSSMCLHLNLVL
jgi:hypothetical protein